MQVLQIHNTTFALRKLTTRANSQSRCKKLTVCSTLSSEGHRRFACYISDEHFQVKQFPNVMFLTIEVNKIETLPSYNIKSCKHASKCVWLQVKYLWLINWLNSDIFHLQILFVRGLFTDELKQQLSKCTASIEPGCILVSYCTAGCL